MHPSNHVRSFPLLALATVAAIGFASPAVADDIDITFPAGGACQFELRLEAHSTDQQHVKQFFDKSGEIVRMITAGKGHAITFTNVATGASISFKPNGFSDHDTFNADGSTTLTIMGHVALILGATDVPPGPSTVFYVGKLVFTIDSAGTATLQESSGRQTDVCAALA